MIENKRPRGSAYWAILGGIIITFIVIVLAIEAGRACTTAKDSFNSELLKANGCFEFWLNRYQVGAQTVVSGIIGIAGLIFIIKQLRKLTQQNEITAKMLTVNIRESNKNWRTVVAQAIQGVRGYNAAAMDLSYILQKNMGAPGPTLNYPPENLLRAPHADVAIAAAMEDSAVRAEWRRLLKEFGGLALYVGSHGDPDARRMMDQHPAWSGKLPKSDKECFNRLNKLQVDMDQLTIRLDE